MQLETLKGKNHQQNHSVHKQRKRKSQARRRTPPGTPPGTLVADPESLHPKIRTMAYGSNEVVEQALSHPRQIQGLLDKWPVLWIDVEGLGDADTIRILGEVLGLHRLALEDVLDVHQRPKIEQYPGYYFIVAQMVALEEHFETEQLNLFLGKNFVLTFREGKPGDAFESIQERVRKKHGRIRDSGVDYLAYALLDAVVDRYFPILEQYGERLENLEDEIVSRPSGDIVARIHEIRRHLLTLRRAVWPQRETFNALLREETSSLVTGETRLHLRDCYDHTAQLIDLIETYRELGADLTDVYLSSISNRTNEIMRVLTVIATIFIPLTFIAGVYGMNFNTRVSPWNMPELDWFWGYPLALMVMFVVAVGQLIFFRRKGWLGEPKAPGSRGEEGVGERET